MEILARQEVQRFGRYLVVEGPVLTADRQEISLCWVEDAGGSPVTSFTSRDVAFDLASRLAEYDVEDDLDDEVDDEVDDKADDKAAAFEDRGLHRLQ